MAITRCPYCHAIIDENDKYCNNCGTQLLFPEDDEADEEIPGEKILDAEVEEKDYTVDEPDGEKPPPGAKDLDGDLDEELEKEMREEAAEAALDELVAEEALEEDAGDVTEEVILVDEIEAADAADRIGTGGLEDKDEPIPKEEAADEDEENDEIEDEKIDEDGKDGEEEEIDEEDVGKAEIEYVPVASAPEPATFDTKELEGIGRTVELSKARIDELIEGLIETEPIEAPAVKPAAPAATPAPAPMPGPTPAKDTVREPTGSLPPWASTMKGAPVFPPDTTPLEPKKRPAATLSEEKEEVEIFPRRKDTDSTMGLPERLSQAPLPFTPAEAEGEAEGEGEGEAEAHEAVRPPAGPERPARPPILPVREPERGGAEAAEEYEEPVERPPFSFSVFFKSKAFDVLFVGLFWLVALWLAAHAMGQTLFEVLGSVSGPMLLLFAVFLLLYFFLFKFFLGETLGDRLFRPRE